MKVMGSLLDRKLEALTLPLAVVLPDGHQIGAADAAITIRLKQIAPLAHIAAGEVGKVAQDYVEDKLDFDGSVRALMVIATQMIASDPTQETGTSATLAWWRELTSQRVVRAYRVYLAGSAMAFEQGWMALFQMLAAQPSGRVAGGPMPGAQSPFPFNRSHMYGC